MLDSDEGLQIFEEIDGGVEERLQGLIKYSNDRFFKVISTPPPPQFLIE